VVGALLEVVSDISFRSFCKGGALYLSPMFNLSADFSAQVPKNIVIDSGLSKYL
jgi:hypothetical protein